MKARIKDYDVILFLGDSITAYDRVNRPLPYQMTGYPQFVFEKLCDKYSGLTAYNRATGGETTAVMIEKMRAYLDEIKPTFVSVMIGINDIWRFMDSQQPFSEESFEKKYETIIKTIAEYTNRILILEPFLVDDKDEAKREFRQYLNVEFKVIRKIAKKYHTFFVSLDGVFASKCIEEDMDKYSLDGVHATFVDGFKLIADAWLKDQL